MKHIVFLMALTAAVWAEGVIEVHGTSSLHDWKMVSHTVHAYMTKENDKIKTLQVSMAIETLKSDNEALDNDAYAAFEVDRECPVLFTLSGQKQDGSLEGVIRIGRDEKRVEVMPERIENGMITGAFKAKMSSFGVKPPSLFGGLMKVDDAIEITYTISDDGVPIPAVLLRCLFPSKERMAP
jgi:hypothetical protein